VRRGGPLPLFRLFPLFRLPALFQLLTLTSPANR
jgi:hypothetical protein